MRTLMWPQDLKNNVSTFPLFVSTLHNNYRRLTGNQRVSAAYLIKNQVFGVYLYFVVPYFNVNSPGLTAIGPPMWQAEADRELTLSALPATAAGQSTLTMAN